MAQAGMLPKRCRSASGFCRRQGTEVPGGLGLGADPRPGPAPKVVLVAYTVDSKELEYRPGPGLPKY